MREQLQSLAGIAKENIKQCTPIGLVVDIHGTGKQRLGGHSSRSVHHAGPESDSQAIRCIALRADMDALEMAEENAETFLTDHPMKVSITCVDMTDTPSARWALRCCRSRKRIRSQRAALCGYCFSWQRNRWEEAPSLWSKRVVWKVWRKCMGSTLGTMRLIQGLVMANETMLEIEVNCAGGHGSQPHAATDPVLLSIYPRHDIDRSPN